MSAPEPEAADRGGRAAAGGGLARARARRGARARAAGVRRTAREQVTEVAASPRVRTGGSRRRRSRVGSRASAASTSRRRAAPGPRGGSSPRTSSGPRPRRRVASVAEPHAARPSAVQLTSLRKTIARRLTEAWQAPAFQISMSADMTRALELRARLVERAKDGVKPSYTDILIKVCAAALMRHREVNALFAGDAVELLPEREHRHRGGGSERLVVPVIRGAEVKPIAEIAAERARAGRRARARASCARRTSRAARSRSRTSDVRRRAVHRRPEPAAGGDPRRRRDRGAGSWSRRRASTVRPMMTMTLTCDHRAVDGATAAEFLRTVKEFLEEPGLAL